MIESREQFVPFHQSKAIHTGQSSLKARQAIIATHSMPSGYLLSIPIISKYPLVKVVSTRFAENMGSSAGAP